MGCGDTDHEHRSDVISHGFLGHKDDELDRGELDTRLNALGAEGCKLERLLSHCTARRTRHAAD